MCSCGTKERPAESGLWGSQPECCLRLDFAPLAASSLSQLQPATSRPGSRAKNKGCLPTPAALHSFQQALFPVGLHAFVHMCMYVCMNGMFCGIFFWHLVLYSFLVNFCIFFFPLISYQSQLVLKYSWNPYFSNFLPTLLTRLPPLGSFFFFLTSVSWV